MISQNTPIKGLVIYNIDIIKWRALYYIIIYRSPILYNIAIARDEEEETAEIRGQMSGLRGKGKGKCDDGVGKIIIIVGCAHFLARPYPFVGENGLSGERDWPGKILYGKPRRS